MFQDVFRKSQQNYHQKFNYKWQVFKRKNGILNGFNKFEFNDKLIQKDKWVVHEDCQWATFGKAGITNYKITQILLAKLANAIKNHYVAFNDFGAFRSQVPSVLVQIKTEYFGNFFVIMPRG